MLKIQRTKKFPKVRAELPLKMKTLKARIKTNILFGIPKIPPPIKTKRRLIIAFKTNACNKNNSPHKIARNKIHPTTAGEAEKIFVINNTHLPLTYII